MEQVIDVNKYCVENLHVWPILRTVLNGLMEYDGNFQLGDRSRNKNQLFKLADLISNKFELVNVSLPEISEAKPDLISHQQTSSRGKLDRKPVVCFIGRTDDYTLKLQSGWFSPIIDSWYKTLAPKCHNVKMEILEPQTDLEIQSRTIPPLLISPQSNLLSRENLLLFKALKKQLDLLIQDIHNFNLKELGINLAPEGFYQIAGTMLQSSMVIRNSVTPILSGLNPDVIMMGCSYYYLGYGIQWAASDLEIVGVELQHGYIGEHHYAYNAFTKIPDSGYRLLPKVFNLWGEKSVSPMSSWLSNSQNYHKTIVGGKILLTEELLDEASLVKLNHLKKRIDNYQKVVLISLQAHEHISLTENLILAIKNSPPQWYWLVRCHPLSSRSGRNGHNPISVMNILSQRSIKHYETDLASSLPLDVILSLCDHHVTYFSSVYLEAMAQRIPTTFIHLAADILFREPIQMEAAFLVKNEPNSIINSISNFTVTRAFSNFATEEVENRREVHDQFLNRLILSEY
ncbi:hypothetical protein CMK18_20795 [Candidatus Poribacteria bacterium]|nr:hypothetical protein [Candidatus Poribacteria bacterium]